MHSWYADGIRIWDLEIEEVVQAIQLWQSDYAEIWNVWATNNGENNYKVDPSIWIYKSHNLEILYGYYHGASNGPGGDGEINCRDSNNLTLYGVQVVNSGASGIYLRNCDDAIIENSNFYAADEWGIDVVLGSSNFTAIGNTVTSSYYGGAVFEETLNGSGTFTNNQFNWNNSSGIGTCPGINVIGNVSNVTNSGNISNPNPVICTR